MDDDNAWQYNTPNNNYGGQGSNIDNFNNN